MTDPPLLALAAGERVRARKAPALRPKECQLQFDSAALFHGSKKNPPLLLPGWQAWHTPNGEARPAVEYIDKCGRKRRYSPDGAKLKRMGAKPGIPDWTLLSPDMRHYGRDHFIECKRIGETLSDEQEDFRQWCIVRGIPYVIAYVLSDVIFAAKRWGALDPDVKI